jgi:hypothetical protein
MAAIIKEIGGGIFQALNTQVQGPQGLMNMQDAEFKGEG